MTCTATGCESEATLYLCGHCVRDLQAWIDRVPDIRRSLFTTMSKLDQTAPQNREGGGGLSSSHTLPIREGAMDMRHALRIWEGQDAEQLAHDQYAGNFQDMLIDMCERADRIMDIPPEHFSYGTCGAEVEEATCAGELKGKEGQEIVTCPECHATHDVMERRRVMQVQAKGEPMPPREAREYLATKTGLSVKTKDFENWVKHRKLGYVLDRVTTDDKPKRIYFPGDVFVTHQRMMDRRNFA